MRRDFHRFHTSMTGHASSSVFALDEPLTSFRIRRSGLIVRRRPSGLTAFGIFLFSGAAMATLAGATLIYRGTMVDHIWSLNPRAYSQLARLGSKAGILMLVIAAALSVTGVGWFN